MAAFVPDTLPPKPRLDWRFDLHDKFDRALLALGGLDSLSALLPDASRLLGMFVRKEALLSSKIEGTQSSLSDLLLLEQDQEPSAPVDDVRVVSNYIAALDHGLCRLGEGFPAGRGGNAGVWEPVPPGGGVPPVPAPAAGDARRTAAERQGARPDPRGVQA